MSDSHWLWIEQLELNELPDNLKAEFTYLATIVTLINISTEHAEILWNTKIFKSEMYGRLRLVELRLSKLEKGASGLEVLMITLLSATVAFPISALMVDGVYLAAKILRGIKSRRRSWKANFGNKKYLDPGVGKKQLKSWEQHVRTQYNDKNKVVNKFLDKHLTPVTEEVMQDAVGLLINNTIADEEKKKGTQNFKEEFDIGPEGFWDNIKRPGHRLQELIVSVVKQTHRLSDLGVLDLPIKDIPPLVYNLKSLNNKSAKSMIEKLKWLDNRIKPLKQGDLLTPSYKDYLEKLAQQRLSSVWILDFVAMHVPPPAKIDKLYFNHRKSIADKYTTPFRSTRSRRVVPYMVNNEWYLVYTNWNSDEERIRMQAILMHARRIKGNFRETYLQAASKVVRVRKDSTRPSDERVSHGTLVKFFYDSPELEDARRDYAYILLMRDISGIQMVLFKGSFMGKLIQKSLLLARKLISEWRK